MKNEPGLHQSHDKHTSNTSKCDLGGIEGSSGIVRSLGSSCRCRGGRGRGERCHSASGHVGGRVGAPGRGDGVLRMRERDGLDQGLGVGASGGGSGFGAGVGEGKCRQDSQNELGQLHFVCCLLLFGLFLGILASMRDWRLGYEISGPG